jgi:hypothetical protein
MKAPPMRAGLLFASITSRVASRMGDAVSDVLRNFVSHLPSKACAVASLHSPTFQSGISCRRS